MTRIPVTAGADLRRILQPAVEWLRQGGIVALPTDTFYGLAVDVRSDAAVASVFDLKGRSAESALPLIAASVAQVEAFCGPLNPATRQLARVWWPGPLSVVCDAPPDVSAAAHGGTGTVAVRVPAHPVARALAEGWGAPIAATSANRSGDPAVMTAEAIRRSLTEDPRVLVIDGGATTGGAPSTIVDARGDAPRAVRVGAIAWDRVLRSLQA